MDVSDRWSIGQGSDRARSSFVDVNFQDWPAQLAAFASATDRAGGVAVAGAAGEVYGVDWIACEDKELSVGNRNYLSRMRMLSAPARDMLCFAILTDSAIGLFGINVP